MTTLAGVDRKTVRRYAEAGKAAGLDRDGRPGQLTAELLGRAVAVRPARPPGTGASWETIAGERDPIAGWLGDASLQPLAELVQLRPPGRRVEARPGRSTRQLPSASPPNSQNV